MAKNSFIFLIFIILAHFGNFCFSTVLEYNDAKVNSGFVYTKNEDIYILFLCIDSSDVNFNNYMDLLKKVDANWFSEDVNFFYILYEDERMQRVFENNVKKGLDSGKAQFKFVKYI